MTPISSTRRLRALLASLLLAASLTAGCMQDEQGAEGDGGGDGTDGDGDGGMDGNATGEISSVTITSNPDSVAPGGSVDVCWHVDGSGTVPHVALHWDTESHEGDNVTFQDYDEGLVWPDNESSAAENGYELPGDFCAAFDAPATSQDVYYRAHAMVTPPGTVSDEGTTSVSIV